MSSVGKSIAATGVVLAFVCIWVDAFPHASYWSGDGTSAAFCLALAVIAALLLAAGFARRRTNGALFAVGAVMLGYYAFVPAVLAFNEWDRDVTLAGTWLALAAGALIVVGAGIVSVAAPPDSTPTGMSLPALVAGMGIALLFPGIFLDATETATYWNDSGQLGHVMLALAIAAWVVWAAAALGVRTRGVDQALVLVLLGLAAFLPVNRAFGSLGALEEGAWLALAGGILAAGGTWAARNPALLRAGAVTT